MNPYPKENWPLQGALSLETQRFLPDKESKTEKSVSGKIIRNPSEQALCLFFCLRNSPCNDILISVRVSGYCSVQITLTAKSTANTLLKSAALFTKLFFFAAFKSKHFQGQIQVTCFQPQHVPKPRTGLTQRCQRLPYVWATAPPQLRPGHSQTPAGATAHSTHPHVA